MVICFADDVAKEAGIWFRDAALRSAHQSCSGVGIAGLPGYASA